MDSRVQIFPTVVGGANWAWMLWRRAGAGWAMLACQTGFETKGAAIADYQTFLAAANAAVMEVKKKETPSEAPKKMRPVPAPLLPLGAGGA